MDINEKTTNMETTDNTSAVNEPLENRIKRAYAPHRRVSIRQCQDCGHYYIMPDSDAVYYATKYGNLPQRCDKCRERVREKNPWNKPTEDNNN